ncbi:MAG: ABC transporter permease [Epsilonproteobacteria bacterium]|nr:ABC transporter permease [Campylobacterota bacterium]
MQIALKKLLYVVLMLFLISLISFIAVHLAPNSFLSGGELNPNMTKEAVEALKEIYGLDKPLLTQYTDWIKNLLLFNFGVSFVSGIPVIEEISKRIGITLTMNIITLVVVFIISIYLGIKAAFHSDRKLDLLIRQFSLISFSMPSFYLALLLIILFSLELGWFPISGLHSLEVKEGIAYYIDMLWHIVLPVFVMIFVSIGSMTMYIRSLTLEILKSDYYFFAKARNLSNKKILKDFIIPNLLPPIVTLLGLSLPGLIGGSVILEAIFGIDGMGQLFYSSALSRDYPVIMGILIIGAFLTLVGNVIADLILLKINPFTKR